MTDGTDREIISEMVLKAVVQSADGWEKFLAAPPTSSLPARASQGGRVKWRARIIRLSVAGLPMHFRGV